MSRTSSGAGAPFWAVAALLAGTGGAFSQGTIDLPDIVVTANRRAEPIARSGSAISVVTREEIDAFSPSSLVDALRNVPGLDITETGGPGATTAVRLRGAGTGQTLVLIDGIRVNDSVPASGDFDFATLLPSAIDRIEVLRGPQSALYGSDAIGGVVNIITRSGGGTPRFETRTEAGSYGTLNTSATASGSVGPFAYAFSGGGQRSAGFSRYGFRIGQLDRRFGGFEPDGYSRYGGHGRLAYDAGEGVKLEIGALTFKTASELDAASSTLPRLVQATGASRIFPDTPGEAERRLTQIFARGTAEQGPLTHTLTTFANQTDRTFRESAYRTNVLPANTTRTVTDFFSDRVGTEYQGDLKLGPAGSIIVGGKYEIEKGRTFSTPVLPTARPTFGTFNGEQRTRAVFALYQLPIGERIILTAGGRHDEVDSRSFDTWRSTGAYLIPETGTKLRASGGTGGKAPTLFQLFSPQNGNAALAPRDLDRLGRRHRPEPAGRPGHGLGDGVRQQVRRPDRVRFRHPALPERQPGPLVRDRDRGRGHADPGLGEALRRLHEPRREGRAHEPDPPAPAGPRRPTLRHDHPDRGTPDRAPDHGRVPPLQRRERDAPPAPLRGASTSIRSTASTRPGGSSAGSRTSPTRATRRS